MGYSKSKNVPSTFFLTTFLLLTSAGRSGKIKIAKPKLALWFWSRGSVRSPHLLIYNYTTKSKKNQRKNALFCAVNPLFIRVFRILFRFRGVGFLCRVSVDLRFGGGCAIISLVELTTDNSKGGVSHAKRTQNETR